MKINWNFIETMKNQRGLIVYNKKVQAFLKRSLNLKGNEKIIDVGCGIGTIPHLLNMSYKNNRNHDNKLEIFGIDISKELISWGEKHWGKARNIHLSVGDAHDLAFADETFDVVISFGLLEWVTNPDSILKEMIRVIKPNGLLAVLAIELGGFVEKPRPKYIEALYNDYINGLKQVGYPIKHVKEYLGDLYTKNGLIPTFDEFVLETREKITAKQISLWKSFPSEEYEKNIKKMMEFYFQFLQLTGWTLDRFWKVVMENLSLEKSIEFFSSKIGQELVRRTPLTLVKSRKTLN
ncbi:MAG: class I SAM-dependent methyltransferase [Candidatus Helarchaeota archaeon]